MQNKRELFNPLLITGFIDIGCNLMFLTKRMVDVVLRTYFEVLNYLHAITISKFNVVFIASGLNLKKIMRKLNKKVLLLYDFRKNNSDFEEIRIN